MRLTPDMSRASICLAIALAACSSSAPPPEPQPAPVVHYTPPLAPVRTAIALPSADEIAARELTADEQVKQAIDRLSFGPRAGEYDSVRAMGVDKWIAQQLDPAAIPDPDGERFAAAFPMLTQSATQLLTEFPTQAALRKPGSPPPTPAESAQMREIAKRSRALVTEMQAAKVGRALVSERQLEEVMVDFWFNHFNVYADKGPIRAYLPEYERDVIRPYALGNFRDLLGAVAHSPAMLFYLDNWESRANPDEPTLVAERPNNGNAQGGGQHRGGGFGGQGGMPGGQPPGGAYGGGRGQGGRGMPPGGGNPAPTQAARRARQGLNENYGRELLELHTLGVDGGYTQEDVINVARILTGWSIDKPQQNGTFIFRAEWHDAGSKTVLGVYFPAGNGVSEGDRLLDLLAKDPHTATHIATKLVQRFVSDTAPPELVARAAAAFTKSGGDIRETVRVIVQSPEFFSRTAYHTKVKSPLRLVVSALRAVSATPDTSPRTAQIVARLGEPLYLHLAPNGYPSTGEAWINTGAILNRINFGLALAAGRVPGASLTAWPQGAALEKEPHAEQVDGVIALILQGEAGPDTRRILERGVNPMLANAPPDSMHNAVSDSLAALDEVDAEMNGMAATSQAPMNDHGGPPPDGAPPPPQGLKKTGIAGRANPLAKIPDLAGFAQVVGLALGAPEFQRH